MKTYMILSAVLSLLMSTVGWAGPVLRTSNFTHDPEWDEFRNRLIPKRGATVVQDFGWSRTRYAGSGTGEIGGVITRSLTPAFYGQQISTKTFNDQLTMSGRFVLRSSSGGSAAYFGWFNSARQGWRPVNFLGFRLDGESGVARIFVDYTSGTWKAGGINTGLQVQADGTPHTFTLSFDPAANGGDGALAFTLDGGPAVIGNLSPGHRATGASFDRFGLFNCQVPGGPMAVYFDGVTHDGSLNGFSADPMWQGAGNRTTFVDYELGEAHNFGWNNTNYAGGAGNSPGEIGGLIWRVDPSNLTHAYYADPVGPLGLDQQLFVSGKLAFTLGNSDSAVYIGWFNGEKYKDTVRKVGVVPPPDFVGIIIDGPSRDGYYFRAYYVTAGGSVGDSGHTLSSPIMPDGTVHTWSLVYDPQAANGKGGITLKLDDESVILDLGPGHKKQGAVLDRFGIFTMRAGGHAAKVYIDDLTYTAGGISVKG